LDQQLQLQGRELNAAVEQLGQEPQAVPLAPAAPSIAPTSAPKS
jgi:hypothetical protein